MDVTMVVLRIVHIGAGVFWAGAMLLMALFVERAVRRAGPAGGAVMQELTKLGYMTVMPIVALLTIISGFWMFGRASGGQAEWFRSPFGMTLGVGGMVAVLAFLIGIFGARPLMLRVARLGAEAQAAPPEQREALLAALGPLRARATFLLRLVAAMLAVVVAMMAVARYV
jgi:hypothetical protein